MAEALSHAVPAAIERHARKMLERACEKDLRLATAESCTGGMLAALLTDVPGCSHIFDRGFVSYSDAAKCDLLGVERSKVAACGAVSREVAIAMASGALERSSAGVAIAITGFAGPGGEGDEEGLVHLACARAGEAVVHREEHFGPRGRAAIRIDALAVALAMVDEALRI